MERLRYICPYSPVSTDGVHDDNSILFFPTLTSALLQKSGANGSINSLPFVDYVGGSLSSWLVDRQGRRVLGEEMKAMVAMVLTANGNQIQTAIKKKLSNNEVTIFASTIAFDPRSLEGLEHSTIWVTMSIVNTVLAIACQVYVFYILRKHFLLNKRAIKLDYCYCSLFTATVGNAMLAVSSYDTLGFRGLIVSAWGIQMFVTHMYCVIFSFGFCLSFWEEAVFMIINSLKMKMKTLSKRRRVAVIILFLSNGSVQNIMLYLQTCGYFPSDILSSVFIMSGGLLVILVAHMIACMRRVLRAIMKVDNKVSASAAPKSEVPAGTGGGGGPMTPKTKSSDSKWSEGRSPLKIGQQKSKDMGVSSPAVTTMAAQGHVGAQLQMLYDAMRKKLLRFLYVKMRSLVFVVWILINALLLYLKVHIGGIVAYCLLTNGFSTAFVVLQIVCLRTLAIASESQN